MKTILVPLDGSEFAEGAIAPAARLAARHEATLALVSVVSDLPPVPLAATEGEMLSHWFEEEKERAETYLAGVEEHLSGGFQDVEVTTRVELGPVARTVMTQAAELDADLIALTTHGRGTWQRAWLGSVADAILREGRRPTLLLREGDASANLFEEESSPAHVLIPLDGSEASEEILGPVTSLLPAQGGKVTLLHTVREPFPLASSYLPHAVEEEKAADEQRERAREHLEETARRWSPMGVEVDTEVLVSDDVAASVLEYAHGHPVDLLALSTRGRGGVGRLLLGSVADKLLRGSEIPVLSVRRSKQGDD
ncbi:MAG: universal stress protein [bacterium]